MNAQLLQESKHVPQQIIAKTQVQLDGFNTLKRKIIDEVNYINFKAGELKERIKASIIVDENGLLPRKAAAYLETLDFNLTPLKKMVEEDKTYWDKKLESAHFEAARIESEIQAQIKKSQREMEEILARRPVKADKYSLRRLPLWGENIGPDEINDFFEYPSQGIFDYMDTAVTLTSLEFKMSQRLATISSVRANYSNGQKSPIFENADYTNDNESTVTFEDIKKVSSVTGACDFAPMTYLTQIKFYDHEDNMIAAYNPKNRNDDEHVQALEENEELFGVYGVKDK